jgi:hypothetical protein
MRSGETHSQRTCGAPEAIQKVAGRLLPRHFGMSRGRESLLLRKHGLSLRFSSSAYLATSSVCHMSRWICDLCCI